MAPQSRTKTLHDALEAFETSLEMPWVPGELEEWLESAQESFVALQKLWEEHRREVHSGEFESIESDPNQAARVERLKREDQRLKADFAQLAATLERLPARVSEAETDEESARDQLESLSEQGIALVIRARKQELAAHTWLLEALDRDLGEGG